MRAYQLSRTPEFQKPQASTVPGFRLSEVIDQFYAEGVVPDFLPADLGEDKTDEIGPDGWPAVDPDGRIDVDPMERREAALMAGIKDPDPAPSPTPSPSPLPDPAPSPTPSPEPTE